MSRVMHSIMLGFYLVKIFTLLLQSAVGSDYVASVEKHSSQTDAAKGFGGKYGVQKDRQDKVCAPYRGVQLLGLTNHGEEKS